MAQYELKAEHLNLIRSAAGVNSGAYTIFSIPINNQDNHIYINFYNAAGANNVASFGLRTHVIGTVANYLTPRGFANGGNDGKSTGHYFMAGVNLVQCPLNKIERLNTNFGLSGAFVPYTLVHFHTSELMELINVANTNRLILTDDVSSISNLGNFPGENWNANTKFQTLRASIDETIQPVHGDVRASTHYALGRPCPPYWSPI